MGPQQRWGWDLEEMRNAGQMAEYTPTLVSSCTPPVISGFTPINRPQVPMNPGSCTSSMTQSSGKPSSRDKIQASEDIVLEKRKRKGLASSKSKAFKKPRSNQTSVRSKKTNISKDLRKPKPGLKSAAILSDEKPNILSNNVSFASIPKGFEVKTSCDRPSIDDDGETSATLIADTEDFPQESRHISLAERYQAEYDLRNVREPVDIKSAPYHQDFSDQEEHPVYEDLEGIEQVESLRSTHHHRQSLNASQQSPFWHSDSREGFVPPPSAQPPRLDLEKALESSTLGCDAHLLSSAVHEDCNNFDVNDAFGSDINKLLTYESYFEEADSEFPENAIFDDNSVQEFDEWPDDVSMPDAVTIYDEELKQNSYTESPYAGTENPHLPAALHPISGNIEKAGQPRKVPSKGSENEFDDSDLESSLIDLHSPTKAVQSSTPHTSPLPTSSPKLKWLPPKAFTPSQIPAKVPVSVQNVPHLVPKNDLGTHLPFVRPPFPKPVRDRSPILGLTNTTVLRTCFRIGEALNAAAQASRSKIDAIVELYARVIASSREANGGFKQSFQFADLFNERPPYLSGVSSIWKGVGLWDQDSRVFLGEAGKGKMCRAVGRIKKGEGQQSGCHMTVLSIWEVDWEDVGIAKGGVCF